MSIQVRPDAAGPGPRITGFADGGFRIDGRVMAAALLTPQDAVAWDAPPLDALDAGALAPLVAVRPEFILIGTGAVMARPPRALVDALDAEGIGVEAMDSRAAARAWGILRGEDRWIGAALLPLA
ncbi:MAG: Mth938-like domain-containing protein [Sphingobium sp.]